MNPFIIIFAAVFTFLNISSLDEEIEIIATCQENAQKIVDSLLLIEKFINKKLVLFKEIGSAAENIFILAGQGVAEKSLLLVSILNTKGVAEEACCMIDELSSIKECMAQATKAYIQELKSTYIKPSLFNAIKYNFDISDKTTSMFVRKIGLRRSFIDDENLGQITVEVSSKQQRNTIKNLLGRDLNDAEIERITGYGKEYLDKIGLSMFYLTRLFTLKKLKKGLLFELMKELFRGDQMRHNLLFKLSPFGTQTEEGSKIIINLCCNGKTKEQALCAGIRIFHKCFHTTNDGRLCDAECFYLESSEDINFEIRETLLSDIILSATGEW